MNLLFIKKRFYLSRASHIYTKKVKNKAVMLSRDWAERPSVEEEEATEHSAAAAATVEVRKALERESAGFCTAMI